MTPRPIIIDCDPGHDDAINLLVAMSSPDELEILGVTTVAGNVPLALTTRNARLVCDIAKRADVAVFAGCSAPLNRILLTAERVHGATGIDGIEIVEPKHGLQSGHAVAFIVDTLRASDDNSITLVLTGPLTNVASAFIAEPDIACKVARIVLMGGALREGGNASPSAEFNMLVDPHAADIVFRCGRPITVMGLDVSYQAPVTTARKERIRALGNGAGRATAAMLDHYNRNDTAKYGALGAPLHDPCTAAFLLRPDLFEGKACNLSVETDSELTMGHTAIDFWQVTDRRPNVEWMHSLDAEGFYELIVQRLARLP